MKRKILQKKREIDRLFSISNLGERFKKSTFEAFREREGAVTASQVAQKYVNEFKKWNGESLMIWGEPGNGKTHLAASIANELSKQGYIVVFQSVPELYNVFEIRLAVKTRKVKHKLCELF